ncbi:MAG: transglutaminaseTgpA domain-containing protein [Propionibacteriaceae bacterium]|nr:transglutaminaseTgpA domain-containing protein [Propionibacteriaceae bacterium]
MKAVDPKAKTQTGPTRTMTSRLVSLRPGKADLIDAVFLLAVIMVALTAFATTFQSPRYMLSALAGAIFGIVLAHLANVLRWHWLIVVVTSVVVYFLGGMLAVNSAPLGVARLAIDGWKDMLTVVAPLPKNSSYVVLPYLLAVVVATCGFAAARRTRAAWPAAVLPTALVAGSIALGTQRPAAAVPVGLGYALIIFLWLAMRAPRRRRLMNTGSRSTVRILLGAVVLLVATSASFFAGPYLPGLDASDRVVARTYVQPPVVLPQLGSPLASFRKFSSPLLAKQDPDHNYYNQDLLQVDQVPDNTWLRFAVMDDYNGTAWTATGGGSGATRTGFQRIGIQIPNPPEGATVSATITIGAFYATFASLQNWVPSVGNLATVDYNGDDAQSHIASQYLNESTSQILLPDSLQTGDVIDETAVPYTPLDMVNGPAMNPGGSPLMSAQDLGFLADGIAKAVPSGLGQWAQLQAAAKYLHDNGYWSDGTPPGEDIYHTGHEEARLAVFLNGETYPVGSDEQYAAAFALIAESIGYPARVVMGAQVPTNGTIQGKDVTAWVEVLTDDGQWHSILPGSFIPDRTKAPKDIPPVQTPDKNALDVPPPNPVQPPVFTSPRFVVGQHDVVTPKANPWTSGVMGVVWVVLRWAGPPIALIAVIVLTIIGLKAQRRTRRSKKGELSTQVASGWDELMDVARDMGHKVPPGTRLEQLTAVGLHELTPMAQRANHAVFGPAVLSAPIVQAFWDDVRGTRKALLASLGRVRRWRARLSVRSFLPKPTTVPAGQAAVVPVATVTAASVVSSSPGKQPGVTHDSEAMIQTADRKPADAPETQEASPTAQDPSPTAKEGSPTTEDAFPAPDDASPTTEDGTASP